MNVKTFFYSLLIRFWHLSGYRMYSKWVACSSTTPHYATNEDVITRLAQQCVHLIEPLFISFGLLYSDGVELEVQLLVNNLRACDNESKLKWRVSARNRPISVIVPPSSSRVNWCKVYVFMNNRKFISPFWRLRRHRQCCIFIKLAQILLTFMNNNRSSNAFHFFLFVCFFLFLMFNFTSFFLSFKTNISMIYNNRIGTLDFRTLIHTHAQSIFACANFFSDLINFSLRWKFKKKMRSG